VPCSIEAPLDLRLLTQDVEDSQQTIFPFLGKSDACFGCEGKTEQEIRLF